MQDPVADRPNLPRWSSLLGAALTTVLVMLPASSHAAVDIRRQQTPATLTSGASFDVPFRPIRLAIHVNREDVEGTEEGAGSSGDGSGDGSGDEQAGEPRDSSEEASSAESS